MNGMRMCLACLVVLAFAGASSLPGCGGGGSGGGTPSSFAGTWVGPWADTATHQSGTLAVTVAQDGRLTGALHNATLGIDGTASGSVDNAGHLTATYAYPGQAAISATGTLAISQNGHLTGVVQETVGGQAAGSAAVDLTKQ